jgi:two-component system KDP operon response regulator KdpE
LTKLPIHTDGRGPLWISLHVCTDTGREALRLIAPVAPDAVLLDLGLPDVDGKEVLREARGFSKAPVIVFVRARSLSEKNLSLDASADVYLERPFRVGELMARQRVALRRSSKAGGITPSLRRIVVELDKRLVTRNVKPVKLTPEAYKRLSANWSDGARAGKRS